jgi:hypothetical protein
MMNYHAVFDLGLSGYRYWWFPTAGLVFVCIGSLLFFFPQRTVAIAGSKRKGVPSKVAGALLMLLGSIWAMFIFYETYSEYSSLAADLRSGQYLIAEGQVRNFIPMPYTGHALETFEVNGVHFSYSDFVVNAGFNNTQSHGGPIRRGLFVKISYVGNHILRLEIANP